MGSPACRRQRGNIRLQQNLRAEPPNRTLHDPGRTQCRDNLIQRPLAIGTTQRRIRKGPIQLRKTAAGASRSPEPNPVLLTFRFWTGTSQKSDLIGSPGFWFQKTFRKDQNHSWLTWIRSYWTKWFWIRRATRGKTI